MTLIATNPATGDELGRYDTATPAQVETAVARAHDAFLAWRARPLAERADLVRGLASTLRTHKDELAALATAEMGKILGESAGEVEKSAWFCEYYADQAAELLAPRRIDGDQLENWVEQVPLGPIVAVMPWNFPYVQVFRFAPAMLVAGNVVLLKHAPNVPGCALRIARAVRRGGLPGGDVPDGAQRRRRGRADAGRPARARRDAHGLRACRVQRGRDRRARAEDLGPRARRLGPLRRARGRRHRAGRGRCGRLALHERRPGLHQRQAPHRRRAGRRRVRAGGDREDAPRCASATPPTRPRRSGRSRSRGSPRRCARRSRSPSRQARGSTPAGSARAPGSTRSS